jgi:hypothetical protein
MAAAREAAASEATGREATFLSADAFAPPVLGDV